MKRLEVLTRICLIAMAFVASAPLAGCGDELVRVGVEMGLCSSEALATARSTEVLLKRDDGATWLPPCATIEPGSDIGTFSGLLARQFSFREVPTGGTWTLVVRGYDSQECDITKPLFCGRTSGFELPPAGEINVALECPPGGELEEFKACLRE